MRGRAELPQRPRFADDRGERVTPRNRATFRTSPRVLVVQDHRTRIFDADAVRMVVTAGIQGSVDDFVHSLAGLNLEAGAHHVELLAPGCETLAVDMKIETNLVIAYRAVLKSIQR